MKILKKSFLIFLIAAALISETSCGKDDEPATTNSQLIGLWNIESVVVSECSDPGVNGTSTCAANPTKCETLEIKTETLSVDGDPFVPYTTSGNTITYDGDTWTYSVTSTTLILTYKFPEDCKEVSTYKRA